MNMRQAEHLLVAKEHLHSLIDGHLLLVKSVSSEHSDHQLDSQSGHTLSRRWGSSMVPTPCSHKSSC